MICGNCGAENRAGRKFCAECGTALTPPCPTCGAHNEPSEKYCGECGTPLSGAAVAPAPKAATTTVPQAERRLVSILFVDLVGSTALAEGRDPEETRDLLTRYFDLARDVIVRYGGSVEKFIGDAVMRDAAAAGEDLERSQPSTRRGRAIEAERTGIRAGIAALEGRPDEAMAGFRAALGEQRDLGLEWYEALCTLDVAPLLDPDDPEVRAEVERTRRILIRLRATPFIARLDGFLAASPPAPVQPVGS